MELFRKTSQGMNLQPSQDDHPVKHYWMPDTANGPGVCCHLLKSCLLPLPAKPPGVFSLYPWQSNSNIMKIKCLSNMVMFRGRQPGLFLLDTWKFWHWTVVWTYWIDFPEDLEMTLNKGQWMVNYFCIGFLFLIFLVLVQILPYLTHTHIHTLTHSHTPFWDCY